ncbi:hypothetical protein TNCV_3361321 [Trichonephila clavipes]|nr:hypothetical protein TNCV_3361321 [Trichonephila clavipes]
MKPRCLKCGKDYATLNCLIKEKDRKIHSVLTARTTVTRHAILNVPNSPNRKKEPRSLTPRKKEISPLNGLKRGFPNQTLIENKKEDSPRGFLSQDNNNTSDLTQVLELFNIISNLVKKTPKS